MDNCVSMGKRQHAPPCCLRYTCIYDVVIVSLAFMHIEEVYVRVLKKYMRSVLSYF
jgi:hypothetical protein